MEDAEDIKRLEDVIAKHNTEAIDDFDYGDYLSDDEDQNPVADFNENEPYIPKTDISKLETFPASSFITSSEKAIIDSCTNPQLKELLILNRQKNLQLKEMYRRLKELLFECHSNIGENERNLKAMKDSIVKRDYPRIWKLGIPYFKTADDFPCPRNADALCKANNGELLIYDMTPVKFWNYQDVNRLIKGVCFYHRVNKETELKAQLTELQNNGGDQKEIKSLTKELKVLIDKKPTLYPSLGAEKDLNWQRIALRFLKDKYCVEDCQIFWRFYAHPKLNQGPWDQSELDKLQALVTKYKCQNWDLIAEELGTHRTGYIVSRHYFSKVNPPKLMGRFTPEEDQKLIQLVKKHTEGGVTPWAKIARQFNGRTRGQLLCRYKYYLDLGDVSKDKFTEAEDILLLALIDRFGPSFSKCAPYFPRRSLLQIKSRYNSTLRAAVRKGYFDQQEDETILQHVEKHGKTWNILAPILGRRNDQIRQRYMTLVRFMEANPWASIKDAPRRKFFGGSDKSEYDWLRFMAGKLKGCAAIPTLEDVERLLKSTTKDTLQTHGQASSILGVVRKDEPVENVVIVDDDDSLPSLSTDDLITEYFLNSIKKQFEEEAFRSGIVQAAAGEVGNILSVLQANLHIPINFGNANLDEIDLKILEVLVDGTPITINDEYVVKHDLTQVDWAVPPTLSTVLGMRNLLLKNHTYKTDCATRQVHLRNGDYKKEKSENQMFWCINNYLASRPPEVRIALNRERQLFSRRYFSLFKLPAVMSLVKPHSHLADSVLEKSFAPRTYEKRTKINGIEDTKTAVSFEPPALTTHKTTKPSMAEEMKRRLHETLHNLKPKQRAARRTFQVTAGTSPKVETSSKIGEDIEERAIRLKRKGKHLAKTEKKIKSEEKAGVVSRQDVEDLKLLEEALLTKSEMEEEEESFDLE